MFVNANPRIRLKEILILNDTHYSPMGTGARLRRSRLWTPPAPSESDDRPQRPSHRPPSHPPPPPHPAPAAVTPQPSRSCSVLMQIIYSIFFPSKGNWKSTFRPPRFGSNLHFLNTFWIQKPTHRHLHTFIATFPHPQPAPGPASVTPQPELPCPMFSQTLYLMILFFMWKRISYWNFAPSSLASSFSLPRRNLFELFYEFISYCVNNPVYMFPIGLSSLWEKLTSRSFS